MTIKNCCQQAVCAKSDKQPDPNCPWNPWSFAFKVDDDVDDDDDDDDNDDADGNDDYDHDHDDEEAKRKTLVSFSISGGKDAIKALIRSEAKTLLFLLIYRPVQSEEGGSESQAAFEGGCNPPGGIAIIIHLQLMTFDAAPIISYINCHHHPSTINDIVPNQHKNGGDQDRIR